MPLLGGGAAGLQHDRVRELLRVRILLEPQHPAPSDAPDVRELGTHLLPRAPVTPRVGAEHHDVIPGVQLLLGRNGEPFPLGAESHEYPFEHRLRPHVRVTIRVDKILRFIPFYALVHLPKHRRDITTPERLV
jgi:hypothetical protein